MKNEDWDKKALQLIPTWFVEEHPEVADELNAAISDALRSAYRSGIDDSANTISGSALAYGRVFADLIRELKD